MWHSVVLVAASCGALAVPKVELGDYVIQRAIQTQLHYRRENLFVHQLSLLLLINYIIKRPLALLESTQYPPDLENRQFIGNYLALR